MDKEGLVCARPSWALAMPGHCNVSALYMCGESCSILHSLKMKRVHAQETTVRRSHAATASSSVTEAENWSNRRAVQTLLQQLVHNNLFRISLIKYLQSACLFFVFFCHYSLSQWQTNTLTPPSSIPSSFNALKYMGSIQTHLAP